MTSTFNENGISIDRYADVISRLIDLVKGQWGESAQTDQDSATGHILRNVALLVAELGEVLQSVYDTRSKAAATGVALDDLFELLGMARQAAAYSTVELTLTAVKATTVPAGSRYATTTEIIFATDEALVFTGAGSATVTATCTVEGAYSAAIGEITEIKTPVYGIAACTNTSAAIPGRNRETDAQFKARHTVALTTTGMSDVASLTEAIASVDGVSSVLVEENDTSIPVGIIPAHCVHAIVTGGTDADIALAIYANKTASVATTGGQSAVVYDAQTAQTKTIYFDRATSVPIYVSVQRTTLINYPDNGDALIKAALVEMYSNKRIGDDVIFTEHYAPIYSVPGHYVTSLKVDTADPPTGVVDIAMTSLQLATLSIDDITISG